MSYHAPTEIVTILNQAGEGLIKLWPGNSDIQLKQELKPDNTLVTEADTSANKFLLETLLRTGLIQKIYSEETGLSGDVSANSFWYLDPLDGTRQFAAGEDDFYILLSCIDGEGRPIEAYVYQPVNQKLVYAKQGQGAWVSFLGKEKKLEVSKDQELDLKLVVSRDLEFWEDQAEKILHTGTAQLQIAEGDLQACLYGLSHLGAPKAWDFAPFDLIITEAGGRVSDQAGELLNYLEPELTAEQFIASNSSVHRQIIKKLAELTNG